jgi:hypothetical protein
VAYFLINIDFLAYIQNNDPHIFNEEVFEILIRLALLTYHDMLFAAIIPINCAS